MNSQLQTLYKDFVQNHIIRYAEWHQSYMQIAGEADSERKKLAGDAGYHLSDSILYKLLWEDKNGIARKGQTPFTKDQYKVYIGGDEGYQAFRPAIENLVRTPYDPVKPKTFIDAYEEFVRVFDRCKHTYNRLTGENARLPKLIINRVTAACTTRVSCIPSEENFDKVFKWFKIQEIFPLCVMPKMIG
jgi:hypothetical protein